MKKSLCAVAFLALVLAAGSSWATMYTWTDTIDFSPDQYIANAFSYHHDLTDNVPTAFNPAEDFIWSYSLNVGLYDDGGRRDGKEIAYIDQPGLLGDGFYNFHYSNETFGWSLLGLLELNQFGKLDVTVTSSRGDFYLDNSTLTATGLDTTPAPVPEPSTLLLLGGGLAGLAIWRRRRS